MPKKDTFQLALHLFALSNSIEAINLVLDGEQAYEYTFISRYEFQFGAVGDMPTNFVVTEDEIQEA